MTAAIGGCSAGGVPVTAMKVSVAMDAADVVASAKLTEAVAKIHASVDKTPLATAAAAEGS